MFTKLDVREHLVTFANINVMFANIKRSYLIFANIEYTVFEHAAQGLRCSRTSIFVNFWSDARSFFKIGGSVSCAVVAEAPAPDIFARRVDACGKTLKTELLPEADARWRHVCKDFSIDSKLWFDFREHQTGSRFSRTSHVYDVREHRTRV